jgi:dual specificity MAP kinase phosphatase/atypical dual specificity phosphatase
MVCILSPRLCSTGAEYYGDTIQRYYEFKSQDMPSYHILQHFESVYEVIEDARTTGGKAFIHCELGVNRSGALTVAYVMVHNRWDPITAAVYVKQKRTLLLSNVSFQQQLIEYAVLKKLLIFSENCGVYGAS